jgi:Kef-type K+ transport system membrane component KefB
VSTNATTEFIIALFLLLTSSVLVGELFQRLGQVALVGQLMVGVILGPTLIGPFIGLGSGAFSTLGFAGVNTIATFFILLMAGLAVSPEQIWDTGVSAALLGIAVFLVPFIGAAAVVHLLYPGFGTTVDLFMALTISITALPVLAVMLREFGLMRTRFGTFLLNSSVINELCAVTTFAILLSITTGNANSGLAVSESVLTVAVFLSSVLAVHMGLRTLRQNRVWDRIVDRFRESWRSREAGFALLMIVGLAAALYSQALGLTFVVGAFYAGLLVTPESAGTREHRTISFVFEAVTWGFFIPLFFALVGFQTDFATLFRDPLAILLFASLAFFALMAKIGIGAAVTRTLGWSPRESLAAGWLLTSRGAVELAMAVILLESGIFTTAEFTIVAGVGLVTTALSPIGARPFVRTITADRLASETGPRTGLVEATLPPRRLEDSP